MAGGTEVAGVDRTGVGWVYGGVVGTTGGVE